MKIQPYIELIETYEELVNVVYDIGTIRSKDKQKLLLKNHLVERRTELLGEIEDQKEKLQLSQI